ncbi:hypothetical protein IMY05_C4652000100 [Salix suchowensis]|nr:hypothetical protein IMY05_C4652000100 [Salix suchowensis]
MDRPLVTPLERKRSRIALTSLCSPESSLSSRCTSARVFPTSFPPTLHRSFLSPTKVNKPFRGTTATIAPPSMIDHPHRLKSQDPLLDTGKLARSIVAPPEWYWQWDGGHQQPSDLEPDGLIDRETAGEQADVESLPKAFTTFSIGVTPDEPKPPRIRSRTSSAKPLAKAASINGDLKDFLTVVPDSASPNRAENQEPPVDLSGAEKKWQFGSTDLNATLERPEITTPNSDGTQFVHASSATAEVVGEPLGVVDIGDSEQLPPFPGPATYTTQLLLNHWATSLPLGTSGMVSVWRAALGMGWEFFKGATTQDGRREPDMMRDQEIREDARRWRDEFDYDRGGRGGQGETETEMGMPVG